VYEIFWEYEVRPDRTTDFEALYGAEGEWTRLFARADGYVETVLYRDTHRTARYLTVDRWRSRAAHETFEREWRAAYADLDRRGDELTLSERRLGALGD
jgi:heme-degrading monooxygenase HmoA